MTLSHVNGDEPATTEVATLLDQVCASVLKLLAGSPHPPRSLTMRAGDVSVDLDLTAGEARQTDAVVAAEPSQPSETAHDVLTAQTVGVFYRAPSPDADPFVRQGDVVRPGQQVGIVEAMKLMIPVEADRTGRIVAMLKGNGEPVEYGEPLFAIEAA